VLARAGQPCLLTTPEHVKRGSVKRNCD
jgi:hypothetical protein